MSIIERAIKQLQRAESKSAPKRAFGQLSESTSSNEQPHRAIAIDLDALRTAGLLPPPGQERRIASQYRHIKRPLLAAAMGKGREPVPNGRLIMVASALSGEGKTFTAINLAFSIAMEKELEVVLVDGDVAKPQISKMFGVQGEKGLLDAIADPTQDAEPLILSTNVPNFSVLPAGSSSDRATELLASDRMREAMNKLLQRAEGRILVFDSSPLVLTTEAPALAGVAGQIVVVVRAESTEQHVLMDGLACLPDGCSPSLILNQSTLDRAGTYYGYGYGVRS